MNENYLQFIWKVKRIPFHLIKTTCNQEVAIKNVGIHNTHESGPDFTNGRVLLNGIEWSGNIEIHIKSSDWYKHKHHKDKAYNNVILHVVYEHDMEVFINDERLHTIELKEFIDQDHFTHWENFASMSNEINCKASINSIQKIYIESMMERAICDRLNRKTFFLKQTHETFEPKQMLYFLLARAFGTKVNQLPFEELTHRLPIEFIKSLSRKNQVALIHLSSGLDFDENPVAKISNRQKLIQKAKMDSMAHHVWKRKGLRPQSRPEVRVQQFAFLIAEFDFESSLAIFDIEHFVQYVQKALDNVETFVNPPISASVKSLIVVNAIIPFLWWYSDYSELAITKEKTLELLERLPPEQNTITDTWKKLGIKAQNAFESQALIELYNEHCMKNKCLSCEVGVQVLK